MPPDEDLGTGNLRQSSLRCRHGGWEVLCSGYQDTGLTHSRTLMPIVEGILKNTGLTVRDCDAVAVSVGPGSFTGIRIGVAAAKGLAFAAEKPVVAVSTWRPWPGM